MIYNNSLNYFLFYINVINVDTSLNVPIWADNNQICHICLILSSHSQYFNDLYF